MGCVGRPASAAADGAAGFASALARGIDGLPPELRYRLTLAEERRDIGCDQVFAIAAGSSE